MEILAPLTNMILNQSIFFCCNVYRCVPTYLFSATLKQRNVLLSRIISPLTRAQAVVHANVWLIKSLGNPTQQFEIHLSMICHYAYIVYRLKSVEAIKMKFLYIAIVFELDIQR